MTPKRSVIRAERRNSATSAVTAVRFLAIANIDVALSKNTMTNRSQRKMKGSLNVNITMPRTISDAWVAKMQQAYQKAAASFPNESAFAYIRQLYVDKMTELRMKLDD